MDPVIQQTLAIIGLIVSGLAAIGALVFSCLNYFHSRKTLQETRLAERRKILITRLNDFYGPLLTYISVIDSLYRVMRIGKPEGFRTLTYLLDPDQNYPTQNGPLKLILTEADLKLFEEILELEKKTEEHIIKHCGLIEDERLAFNYIPDPTKTDLDPQFFKNLGLLSILVAHFRVLRLAYEKKIKGEIDRYKPFVYPREVDIILREKIKQLHTELLDLGGQAPSALASSQK